MTNIVNHLGFSFDSLLEMKDAGLVAASAAAQVGGSDKIADVLMSFFQGALVINVSAIEIASNDELYRIIMQGSTTPGFDAGTIENLAELTLGATEVRPGAALDSTPGRHHLPLYNLQDDVIYRYLRVYTDVSGAIATGINYTAWIIK